MNTTPAAREATNSAGQTRTLHPLDAGWLLLESATNLMHGGVLCVFELPDDANESFIDDLVDDMRKSTAPTTPFDRRLKRTGVARVVPQWETIAEIDPDQHLYRHTLPAPGTGAELDALVSGLQSVALDHDRPLWSLHVIDGLADSRFAIFGKMHHALADGVSALGMVDRWLSDDAGHHGDPALWTLPPRSKRNATGKTSASTEVVKAPSGWMQLSYKSFEAASSTVLAAAKAFTGVVVRPWSAPWSALNTPITADRIVVRRSFDLTRFQQLAKQARGSVNDVVLTVCAGALRHYLSDITDLPGKSLIANIPVSLRSRGGGPSTSNAISWAMLPLGTDIADARERFEMIRAASTKAKAELAGISAINTYTLMVLTPILVEQLAGLGGRVPPMYNVPISNVPGPQRQKYLNGAPLKELYALTVLYGGQALNIVAISYAGQLNLTFTACAQRLPGMDNIAQYCEEALSELEAVYAPRRRRP